MIINVKKKWFNEAYYPHLLGTQKYQIMYGGRGSGKSNHNIKRFLLLALSSDYFRLVYCRKDFAHIRKSMYDGFKMQISEWGLGKLFRCNDGDMRIRCVNGNTLIPAGMSNPDSIKSIIEPTHVWCEEFFQFKREDFETLDNSLRTEKAQTQFVATFNPTSVKSWIKKYFFDNRTDFADGELLLLKTTYLDNRFINQEEYFKKLNRLQGAKRQSDLLGDWGVGDEGIIYDYEIGTPQPHNSFEVFYGVDFGFSNSKTAIVQCMYDPDNETIYLKQVMYATGLLINAIIEKCKSCPSSETAYFYCDSASPQSIAELYDAGLNAIKSNKEVSAGIAFVKQYKLIVDPASKDLVMELDGYQWAKDKNDNLVNMPEKGDDHLCDAFRYAIFTHVKKHNTQNYVY